MKLSEIIKKYRESNNMSQRQLGAQCGLSTGYISLIEKEVNPQTGKRMVPSLPVMNKLASGMGITLDDLLSMCDDMDVTLSEKDIITPAISRVNILRIAGRDGTLIEKRLSDEQVAALKGIIDQFPEADDDL